MRLLKMNWRQRSVGGLYKKQVKSVDLPRANSKILFYQIVKRDKRIRINRLILPTSVDTSSYVFTKSVCGESTILDSKVKANGTRMQIINSLFWVAIATTYFAPASFMFILKGARIPAGHVLVNVKHRGGDVVKGLEGLGIKVLIDDGLGMIDFYPNARCAVVWFKEPDLMSGISKEKLERLRECRFMVTILAEVTDDSNQYFKRLQMTACVEMGMCVIPVLHADDVAKFLAVQAIGDSHSTPLSRSAKKLPVENSIVAFLQTCPGIGNKKVLELLMNFKSLETLASCSYEKLEAVAGKSVALSVKKFFNGDT